VPTFTLSGCAASQTDVALTLERLRLIDGVKEVTLQGSTTGSSGGGGAAGGCPTHDPSYTATVIFDPLPSTSAVAAATKTVSDSSGSVGSTAAPTAAGADTTSGVSAR
jgi:hypothetical protein